jgi:hypothetical protein
VGVAAELAVGGPGVVPAPAVVDAVDPPSLPSSAQETSAMLAVSRMATMDARTVVIAIRTGPAHVIRLRLRVL